MSAVAALMFLIEDLLDLSSLESGLELQYAAVSTRELTTRVLAQLEQKRAAKEQAIETEYKADLVQGDARRVEPRHQVDADLHELGLQQLDKALIDFDQALAISPLDDTSRAARGRLCGSSKTP